MSPRLRLWSMLVMVVLGAAPRPALAASEALEPQEIMQRMASAYDGIRDYTTLFLKRERINGTLLPLETIELRFQAPFKVYMAWYTPHAGRVIVYVEGENDNKMLVNPGGLFSFLRLKLDPSSSLATQNTHHTVREAGLQKTIALLMREYERGQREGQVRLSLQGYEEVAGRSTYHLALLCDADETAGYYAQRGEVWVDTEHFLPIKLALYDWKNQLYAYYEYQRLRLNPELGPEAFRLMPALDEQPLPAQEQEPTSPD
jgi:outer membrane lipoprotein-sorting protein